MIQRIQSLYLLLVAAAMITVAVMPLGLLRVDGFEEQYAAFATISQGHAGVTGFPVWGLGGLALFSALLALMALFLYKQREKQTTLCMVNGFLIGLYYIAFVIFYFSIQRGTDADFAPSVFVALPLIALLFNILSMKAISKDIALLASLDRLR